MLVSGWDAVSMETPNTVVPLLRDHPHPSRPVKGGPSKEVVSDERRKQNESFSSSGMCTYVPIRGYLLFRGLLHCLISCNSVSMDTLLNFGIFDMWPYAYLPITMQPQVNT